MLYKNKKTIGMPVVSLDDGRQLGQIKRLLIDPQTMVVAAFTIDRKGWFKEQSVIPYSHLKNVGSHAVTVDQAQAVVKLSSLPELEVLAKKTPPLLNVRVITEEGIILGTVSDFYFDPQDGKINSLEIKKGLFFSTRILDNNLVMTYGRDAIIVEKGAEKKLLKPAGLFSSNWRKAHNGIQKAFKKTDGCNNRLKNTVNHYWQQLPWKKEKDKFPPSGNNN